MFSPSRPNGNGTMASADSCHLSLTCRPGLPLSRPGSRPPQVRTLTFPAPLPHLLHQPLIAWGFVACCQLARLAQPPMRFVSLRPQVCLRLPSDPTSQWRPCPQLTVGAINLRRGLSPPNQRPWWAHNKAGNCPRTISGRGRASSLWSEASGAPLCSPGISTSQQADPEPAVSSGFEAHTRYGLQI